jgi:hypothetical protein
MWLTVGNDSSSAGLVMYITALQQIRGIEETHRKMEQAMGESF